MLKGLEFHHIGVACNDIESAVMQYKLFGYNWGGG